MLDTECFFFRVDMLVALYLTIIVYHLPIVTREPEDLNAFAPAAKTKLKADKMKKRPCLEVVNDGVESTKSNAKSEGLCIT